MAPIFLEYEHHIREKLRFQKIQEIADKAKLPISVKTPEIPTEQEIKEMENVAGGAWNKDSLQIVDLKIGEDGGFKMYLKGAKEPVRMFPESKSLWVVAYYKRLLPLIGRSFKEMGWIGRICNLIALRANLKVLGEWFDYIFSMEKVLLKEKNYSQPVKELRKVLRDKIPVGTMNALTMIIEIDTAYRYRFQDLISELNQNNLDGFGIFKEVNRLLKVFRSREKMGYISGKIGQMKWLLFAVMIFSPSTRKLIRDILKELDLDELKFSQEDNYWINQIRADYKFKGLSLKERHKLNIEKYGVIF